MSRLTLCENDTGAVQGFVSSSYQKAFLVRLQNNCKRLIGKVLEASI